MELWTKEHFWQLVPSVIVMIIIALVLNKFIGNKPLKIRMIPFQILAVLLFISEIGKQVISFSRGYNLYHIPLHVCSLFIPLIPLMAFYNGRHKEAVRTITCSVTMALMMFMAIYPNLIYGSWNITNFFNDYFDFHTVFYHNVVIFEFILIIVLRLHHIGEGKHVRNMALLGVGFSAVAGTMSQILKTNYANFYTCNIGPINDFVNTIKDALGYTVGQTIYVIILGILHVLFFIGCYYLYRAIDKLNIRLRGRGEE
ncbi:MAG: hypothetical protein IJ360_03250 [Clostridia bacterium]|nr:hypothetical protein [Clostridia bacterium]